MVIIYGTDANLLLQLHRQVDLYKVDQTRIFYAVALNRVYGQEIAHFNIVFMNGHILQIFLLYEVIRIIVLANMSVVEWIHGIWALKQECVVDIYMPNRCLCLEI